MKPIRNLFSFRFAGFIPALVRDQPGRSCYGMRRYSSPLLFSVAAFSVMKARISSAMSSSLAHCSL